ncbi:hypothetical protein J5U18_03245 [Sphingobacteriaceae bacterium WQ 2009]|uniref:DUF4168 domain-containing protein n=1 Tax=Rhinopithecimicrobium faecis TaxID=2820698 RepID=A0A8T4HB63_9SPHI|nr:hypothetical protein [Sphingobacteriaceae bacterium WQ 2009]
MLKFKNLFASLCFTLLLIGGVSAQNRERFQAIENEKVAYITKELNLTPREAQQFFPVYNEYNKSMWSIRSAKVESGTPAGARGFNGARKKTDVIAYDTKEVELKKEYRTKFAQIIGSARSSEFFEVEQQFREKLYKELQLRRNNNK